MTTPLPQPAQQIAVRRETFTPAPDPALTCSPVAPGRRHGVWESLIVPAPVIGMVLPRAVTEIVGYREIPAGPIMTVSTGSRWLLCDWLDDPLAQSGMPVPTRVLENLRQQHASGIRPDRLLVAHEIPGQEGSDNSVTPLTRQALTQLHLHPGTPAATASTARAVEKLGRRAAQTAVNGALGIAAIPAGLLAGLDPIIYGVWNSPAQHGVGLVAELARWDWD